MAMTMRCEVVETERFPSAHNLCHCGRMKNRKSAFNGPRVVLYTSAGMATLFLLRLALNGLGEEGVRAVVRSSAQTSLLFLCAAISASSLRILWPSAVTRWLLANRRYLGISMGISHFIHLMSLIALWNVAQSFRDSLSTMTVIFGGLGFVFCFAMALTSNNQAVRLLGGRNWRTLHKVGGYYLWFIFTQSYVPRMFISSYYALPVAILVATMAVRIAASRRQRQRLPNLGLTESESA